MARLTVVGVRHHSPACARLVADVIGRVRPRFVLIEGPSDMNDRMGELRLPHTLPLALFSYRQDQATGHSRGMWTPFCDYSPEWVALHAAPGTALFIDLPAWHDAFAGEENRYSDRHVRASDRVGELCARLGFEDTDALWDHLFEQPQPPGELEPRLARWFGELRADEPADRRDAPREELMGRYIAWAMAECEAGGGDVVVVCGGYHQAALERGWRAAPRDLPAASVPEGARVGSYLVPFSFKRLDSFAGYASGMPSPAFHQVVWEKGPDEAAETMLFAAARHLRSRSQRVSAADLIAARTLAEGLKALRGHRALARIDVLDGLAGALVKDALDAPLPWTRRGRLAPLTEPMLVEIVAAFSGERVGNLAPGTPRPPLAIDAFAELERAGIALGRTEERVKVDLTTPRGIGQSHVLHRLRVLAIPGIARTRGPSLLRHKTSLTEEWTVVRKLETDAALIEAAIFGATLGAAAAAKLEERTRTTPGLVALAEALVEAALAGIDALTGPWLASIAELVAREASFGALGAALGRLLVLHRGEAVLGMSAIADLGGVIERCFDRGLWLFEGVQGASSAFDEAQVLAVRALRDVIRHAGNGLAVEAARAHAVCERRIADAGAPAGIRGAALGMLWSSRAAAESTDEARAVKALAALARPDSMGDFLAGLFALAREQVVRARALLGAVDGVVVGFSREQFLTALPALRQAFAYFPPREKLAIAESLLETGDGAMALVTASVDTAALARGAEIDRRATELARRFGLGDGA